jgi:glucose-induced degradation protein 4
MPTGREAAPMLSPTSGVDSESPAHSSCPPEEVRLYSPRSNASSESIRSEVVSTFDTGVASTHLPTPPIDVEDRHGESRGMRVGAKYTDSRVDGPVRDSPSPVSVSDESNDCESRSNRNTPSSTSSTIEQSMNDLVINDSPWPRQRVSYIKRNQEA